jgi:hypothetical protein
MSKYLLSFHTVFIVNENIKWLEEFLIYYKNLGFEHFYLYDNEGSKGYGSSPTFNRYGFSISPRSLNDELEMQDILQRYADIITYVKWQPKNSMGEILYNQEDAIRHFISTYGHETEWVALMDLDEFLFSEIDADLRTLLSTQPADVSCIKIGQKKFLDRFLSNEQHVTREYRCINMPMIPDWGPKNLLKCGDFIDLQNIHTLTVKHKTVFQSL